MEAKKGIFSELEVATVPADLREKYFEQTEHGYAFHSKLRHLVIFAHHDLIQDAPMSKQDLLMCRNVMIYFNLKAQAAILVRFHFALKNTGFLFLGKTEAIINRRQIFTPISLKHHLYVKGLKLELGDFLLIKPQSRKKPALNAPTPQTNI